MKVKHFDKLQHYYLDAIWGRLDEGKDVPATLEAYAKYIDDTESDPDEFCALLHRQLADYPAVDPDNGAWRTWGFVVPFPGGQPEEYLSNPLGEGTHQQMLAINIPGTDAIVFCIEKRERALPSASINDALFERAQKMKEREERDLTRKDYAILKEEVTAQLLKTAPVRRVRTYVMFTGRDEFVFTGSQKTAEETNAIIRRSFSSFPTTPAFTSEVLLQNLFKSILTNDDKTFDHGSYVKLRNEEKEVVTVKDGELDDERYTEMLERGFVPMELEFSHLTVDNLRIWLKMNHKGDVKALSTQEEEDLYEDFHSQYEVGESGYQSKIAELWILHRVLGHFTSAMRKASVVADRTYDGETILTGDELDDQHQSRLADGEQDDEDVDDQDQDDTEEEDDDEWAI